MKLCAVVILAAASVLASSTTFAATSDDIKWIGQCVKDNKDEGASVEVVTKYCTCMNNKMSDNETQSITQWEKAHVTERKACDKEAGWR